MADPKSFELDELIIRPGTYFNPQTDVLLVVDDSPDIDTEIFNMEEYEGADWVLISDVLAIDEARREELVERFQVTGRPVSDESPDEDPFEEEEELEGVDVEELE